MTWMTVFAISCAMTTPAHAGSRVCAEDPLAACPEALRSFDTLHAVVRRTRTVGSKTYPQIVEMHWDIAGTRARVSCRYEDSPARQHTTVVTEERVVTTDGLLNGWVERAPSFAPESSGEDPVTRLLRDALASELWRSGWAGQFVALSERCTATKARREGRAVTIDGMLCIPWVYQGESHVTVWIGEDCVPRKISGEVSAGRTLEEEVLSLTIDDDSDWGDDLFEPPSDRPRLDLDAAQQQAALKARKRRLGAGASLRPFTARSRSGERLDEGDLPADALVMFWFDGQGGQAELIDSARTWANESDLALVHMVVGPADGAVMRATLGDMLCLSDTGPDSPYVAFGVHRCPCYFLLGEDRTVVDNARTLRELQARHR